jgi:type II secretory pathway pseudopilin PulG
MLRFRSLLPAPCSLRPDRRRRAFTLVEVLVAAGITAVLAGMIIYVATDVSTMWTRSTGRLSTEAKARFILDQLTLDLSSALYRDDGNVWLAANILDTTGNSGLWISTNVTQTQVKPNGANGSLVLNSASLADARFGLAGVWLRFFTTRRGANDTTNATTTVNTASAPVAVGYQIIRRYNATYLPNLGTSYLLHRTEARPSAVGTGSAIRPGVLESGYNITAAAYTTSTAATNNGATTGDPRSIQVPGSNTPTRNLDSVLADHVIDFGVRCYVRDSTKSGGLRLVFPTANVNGNPGGNTATRLRGLLPGTVPATSANFNNFFPDVVDVMVRILTDEGARLIATYEQVNSPLSLPTGVTAQQYWWRLALANSQVFSRRIVIRSTTP